MEFFCDELGKVSFAGYSFFETDVRGAYTGNLLASNEAIEQRLTEFVNAADLHLLRNQLEIKLSQLIGEKYNGYLGVDMMICRFPEQPVFRIHPCVEVNLRMNMRNVMRLFISVRIRLAIAASCSSRERLSKNLFKSCIGRSTNSEMEQLPIFTYPASFFNLVPCC